MEPVKPYKSKYDYSYTLGAFPTYELVNNKPQWVREVYVHSSYTDTGNLKQLCEQHSIRMFQNDKVIARLSDKENVYVVGVYNKYSLPLDNTASHIMLVNPGNMGNVGTIIRTAIAFGIHNLAIIAPGVDIHNPKVVRGSMGALFHMNIEYFKDFNEYSEKYCNSKRECFSFMLTASEQLTVSSCPKPEMFTLIFGNEATGLPVEYDEFTNPIIIPQSKEVDSLNLTIAAGIGMFMFTSKS